MTISRYAAFAGLHERHDGVPFEVAYMSVASLARFNKGIPPGHHRYRRVGWYWLADDETVIGPFTSSRRAYRDAMAWKPKP